MRYDRRVREIAKEISKGSPALTRMLESSSLQETAAALQLFLINLKKPLIPNRIQSLALDGSNDVAPEIVAQDILGLLREQSEAKHVSLITLIFDLLHSVLKHATSDELTGSNVPISMMPLFFNLTSEHMPKWRRVAIVFVELIRHAPLYFDIPADTINQNRALDDIEQNINMNPTHIHSRILEMNMVLRRFLYRADNRGDGAFFEVYNHVRSSPLRRRR